MLARLVPIGLPLAAVLGAACASSPRMVPAGMSAGMHDHGAMGGPAGGTAAASAPVVSSPDLPPDAAGAAARLAASPRHGEWTTVRAGGDSVRAWVVYPERATKAPVVVVVHEIFGLSTWVRAVADQLAAEGFIAVAPDLLTGTAMQTNPDSIGVQAAVALISKLDPAQVQRRVAMAGTYGMGLPAAEARYGVVGFCWGGSTSFGHAVATGGAPAAGYRTSVVYYGTAPAPAELSRDQVPVLGLYGADDARVTATLPPADSALKALGRTHEFVLYPGAGHGFLRAQGDRQGANLAATRQAWPRTVAWFRQYLEADHQGS